MNSGSTDWPRFPAQQQVRGWRERSFVLWAEQEATREGVLHVTATGGRDGGMWASDWHGPGPTRCMSSWSVGSTTLALRELGARRIQRAGPSRLLHTGPLMTACDLDGRRTECEVKVATGSLFSSFLLFSCNHIPSHPSLRPLLLPPIPIPSLL